MLAIIKDACYRTTFIDSLFPFFPSLDFHLKGPAWLSGKVFDS